MSADSSGLLENAGIVGRPHKAVLRVRGRPGTTPFPQETRPRLHKKRSESGGQQESARSQRIPFAQPALSSVGAHLRNMKSKLRRYTEYVQKTKSRCVLQAYGVNNREDSLRPGTAATDKSARLMAGGANRTFF